MKAKLATLTAVGVLGLLGVSGITHVLAATPAPTTAPVQQVVTPSASPASKLEVQDPNEPVGQEIPDAQETKDQATKDADGVNGHQDPGGVEVPDQPGQ